MSALHGVVWEWTEDFDGTTRDLRGMHHERGGHEHMLVCASAAIGAANPGDYAAFKRRGHSVFSLVRRYIKTAIGFLAFGLVLGGWMIARRELLGAAPSAYLVSAHAHALLAGFGMMMIMGVALWLFPRPARGDTRYRPVLVSIAYWFATLGTAARVAGEVLHATMLATWLGWGIVLAGLAQIVGMVLFFAAMWPRIRGIGSAAREKDGERF